MKTRLIMVSLARSIQWMCEKIFTLNFKAEEKVCFVLYVFFAFFSDTFNAVQQKSDFYWKQIQTDFLEEYSIKTIFPIHLQLLALPGTICAFIYLLYLHCRGTPKLEEHINHRPTFVRGIL